MRVDLSLKFDVIPVVFSHCSSYVFAFLNFTNFGRAEQFAEAATDARAPFDCKCTSYTSRSPLGMAASTYGRLRELHGLQHFHQFAALFLHELQGIVLVTRAGLEGAFSLRGYHYLTAICWVCCGVSISSVGGLERGSGLVLIHLTVAELLLRFHRFSTNDCRGSGPRKRCLPSSTVIRRPTSKFGLRRWPLHLSAR